MAGGTLNFEQSADSGSYIDSKVEWASEANKTANQSDVTAYLYVRKGHTSSSLTTPTSGTWKFELSVNGKVSSGAVSKSVLTDWELVATKTVKGIHHNSDGSKSIVISASITAPSATSYAGHTSKGSSTVVLDAIPRASTITSARDITIGNKCSVKWTPADASFRYKLKFSMDTWSHTTGPIHPNRTTAYTYTGYTIPLEAARQLMYGATGTMTVALYTYSDADATQRIGSADTAVFTVTVPETNDTKPSVSMTLSPISALSSTFDGLYIQGKTKVKAQLTATAKYDASVMATSMKINSVVYDMEDSYTSEYLANYGLVTVYGYAEDSRGFTGSTYKKITVIAYSKPQILPASGEDEVIAARCDSDGNLHESGNYLKIKAKRSYSPVISAGAQKNFCRIQYRYKLSGAESYSTWTTVLEKTTLDSDEVNSSALLGGILDIRNSYLVQIRAIDDIGHYAYTTIEIPTDRVYMHRDKKRRSLAVGKYIEDDNMVDIADDIALRVRGPIESLGGGTIDSLKLGTMLKATPEATIDLNNIKTPGCYYSPNEETSQHITNSPNSSSGFALIVREMYATNHLRQELAYARTTWVRHYNGSTWSEWWRNQATTLPDTASVDYVIRSGTENGWTWRKWKGGTYEMFGTFSVTPTSSTLQETLYRTASITIDTPFSISSAIIAGTAAGAYWITNGGRAESNKIGFRLMSDKAFSTTTAIDVKLSVVGTYL